MFEILLYLTIFGLINLLFILLMIRMIKKISENLNKQIFKKYGKNSFGFIHPSFNDIRINEKIFWIMLKIIMEKDHNYQSQNKIFLFSHLDNQQSLNIHDYFKRFEIEAQTSINYSNIEIVKIKSLSYINVFKDSYYIIQILHQIIVSIEIMMKCPCYYLIDTTNLPFIYHGFKYFSNCRILCYYHYPYIDQNMIFSLRLKKSLWDKIKVLRNIYYNLILKYYYMNGESIDLIIFNSVFTRNSILSTWNVSNNIVHNSPCNLKLYEDITSLTKQISDSKVKQKNEYIIVSFSQFREEKIHLMQIKIFQKLQEICKIKEIKLNIIGTVKTISDYENFMKLNTTVKSLNLEKFIVIEKDLPIEIIKQRFSAAKIGLHTQKNDLSGATLIDMMSAGLIVVAHKSGAPLSDIIGKSEDKCVGILAEGNCFIYI